MLSYVRYYTRPQEDKLLHKNRLNTMLYEMHFFYLSPHYYLEYKVIIFNPDVTVVDSTSQ